jgi:hypothetical protein
MIFIVLKSMTNPIISIYDILILDTDLFSASTIYDSKTIDATDQHD